jgi:hypothetical protein
MMIIYSIIKTPYNTIWNHKIIILLQAITIMGIFKRKHPDSDDFSFSSDNGIIVDSKFLIFLLDLFT